MHSGFVFFSWFDVGISFKDLELVHWRSFEMKQQQTYNSQVFLLDGWGVPSYMIIPSLPFKIAELVTISGVMEPICVWENSFYLIMFILISHKAYLL